MTSNNDDLRNQIINKSELWPVSLQKNRFYEQTYLDDDEGISKIMRNRAIEEHERDRHQIFSKPIHAHEQ